MESFYSVRVNCTESGTEVNAGEYSGVASTLDEAMAKAIAMAKKAGLKSETNHRVVSAHEIGRVQFGLGKIRSRR